MDKCKLCLINDADDTGSHVVPHFLLKRIFNVAKGRDQEISFAITASDVQAYFGRSVAPEKLDEVFGELTDEELQKKAMADLVIDNQWCKSCEKKFADLETFYAETLKLENDSAYQSTNNSLAALMFWLTILWRLSVTARSHFKLSIKDEKKVRSLIDDFEFMKPDKEGVKKHSPVLDEIGYKVYRSPDYHKKIDSKRGTFLFPSMNQQPYCLMVDEFVVLVYMKRSHLKMQVSTFFGFENLNTHVNTYVQGETVTPLSVERYGEHVLKLVAFMKDIKLRWYVSALNRLYHKLGYKGDMSKPIVHEIINKMISDEKKLGRKYTKEDFINCTTIILMQYQVDLSKLK